VDSVLKQLKYRKYSRTVKSRWIGKIQHSQKQPHCLYLSALHGMPARTGDEKGVCPSVCQTRVLWENGRKICPDFYIIRKII